VREGKTRREVVGKREGKRQKRPVEAKGEKGKALGWYYLAFVSVLCKRQVSQRQLSFRTAATCSSSRTKFFGSKTVQSIVIFPVIGGSSEVKSLAEKSCFWSIFWF